MDGIIIEEAPDDKGRLCRLTKSSDGTVLQALYIGHEISGIIKHEGKNEYIEIDGQKRYWRGIIDPLPSDERLHSLNNFVVFVIKPDGMKMEMAKAIRCLIEAVGGAIVMEHDFVYNEIMIRKMYPYFFDPAWEQELFDYLKSGTSRCLLVRGEDICSKMFTLRNSIRRLFGYDKGPCVVNLVHSSKEQIEALRQAMIFFSLEEIVTAVGLTPKLQEDLV